MDKLTKGDEEAVKAFAFALSRPTEHETRTEILRQSVAADDNPIAKEALIRWGKLERTSEEQAEFDKYMSENSFEDVHAIVDTEQDILLDD